MTLDEDVTAVRDFGDELKDVDGRLAAGASDHGLGHVVDGLERGGRRDDPALGNGDGPVRAVGSELGLRGGDRSQKRTEIRNRQQKKWNWIQRACMTRQELRSRCSELLRRGEICACGRKQ